MSFLFNLLAALLPTASVNTLVGVLSSFADKLDEAERRQTDKALSLEVQAKSLEYRAREARNDAARAANISANINKLLG